MTASNSPELTVFRIEWAINGYPEIILIFLFGTPFEPHLAAIKQNDYKISSHLIIFK